MYRLKDPNLIRKALDKSESGMGYQFLSAGVNGRSREDMYVFNAELIVTPRELTDIGYLSVEELLDRAMVAEDFEVDKLLPLGSILGEPAPAGTSTRPFAPAPRVIRQTVDFEGFVRVSAFQNDHRIRSDGSVEKGAFATTIADFALVSSGFAATGRYALPNPASAKYAYVIVPGAGCDIDGGTVRPANSQSGGGVEVEFTKGCNQGSAFRPFAIPEL